VRRPIPALLSNADRLARAVLLFYAPAWNDRTRRLWRTLTGTDEATTRTLCGLARRILAEEAQPSKLEERVLKATKLLAAYASRGHAARYQSGNERGSLGPHRRARSRQEDA
jgi:hypothetical protein